MVFELFPDAARGLAGDLLRDDGKRERVKTVMTQIQPEWTCPAYHRRAEWDPIFADDAARAGCACPSP